jgi:seryl-tRNA synthetase
MRTVPATEAGADLVDDRAALDRFIRAGWVAASRAAGVLAWTPAFESVIADLQAALGDDAVPGPAWYPPVMPLADAERAGYAESFLNLLGAVHALPEQAQGGPGPARSGPDPGGGAFMPTDVVLIPAMCYHVYPSLSGQTIAGSAVFDLSGYCYRHEGTSELGRLRTYRVRERVVIADAATALGWRNEQIRRSGAFLRGLGLAVRVETAADPFFGPGQRLMRAAQLEQGLKFEFVCPLSAHDQGTAVASANYHKDHFGRAFDIAVADAGTAHSACLGFGLERVALALIHEHGDDRRDWPRITAAGASQREHS